MHDLRLSHLAVLTPPAVRVEPAGARETAPADRSTFDQALQRSAAPERPRETERPREPERRDARRGDASRSASNADGARRDSGPQRGGEAEATEHDAPARGAAAPRSAAATAPAAAAAHASAHAPAAGREDDAATAAAQQPAFAATGGTETLTVDDDVSTDAAPALLTTELIAPQPHTKPAADAAAPMPAAGILDPSVLARGVAVDAAAAPASAAPFARPEAAAAGVSARAPALDDEALAIPQQAPASALSLARDRLLEDFERRFESSLARAAGAQAGTPLPAPAAAALPAAPAAPLTVAYAGVATPIGHPAFGTDLAHRVLLFTGQRVNSAEISVSPAELGPIKVSIELRGQEAAVQFAAAHATTRAAIEDALPRLREMLAAQGLQLTQADVGDRAPRDPGGAFAGQGDRGSRDDGSAATREAGARAEGRAVRAVEARRVGLIDVRV